MCTTTSDSGAYEAQKLVPPQLLRPRGTLRCWHCSTSAPRSTASITTFCWHDCNALSGCLDGSLTGFARSSSIALSEWRTTAAVQGLSVCCGVYHKAPYSDHYSWPSFLKSSQHMGQQPTSMRTMADSEVTISQLTSCVADVDVWMKASRLCLNAQKTQLIWLGSDQQLEKITATDVQLLSADLQVMSTVRDLGVVIDSRLTMADHITAVCRSGYYQLRQLRCVVQSLTPEAAMTLVQCPFFCQHTYYCNSVLYGVADNQLQRLQSVQNAAVDWLPVHEDLSTSRQCCNHCTVISRKQCKIGPKLLLRTNRKSTPRFRLAQTYRPWMTLNGWNALLLQIQKSCGKLRCPPEQERPAKTTLSAR